MKKGFTLIELLAVIVILAIIAVIAVPIVLNIIDESKENATLRSADFYLDAVEFSIANSTLKDKNIQDETYPIMENGNICIGELSNKECVGDILEVEVNGETPTSGNITIENGNITRVELFLNGKTIVKNDEGKLVYQEEDAFVIGKLSSVCKSADEQLYATEPLEVGYKYECDVDPNKVGYDYSFYVLNKDQTSVNLIMDRNICKDGTTTENGKTCTVAYNISEDAANGGPATAMEFLNNATKDWKNIDNLNLTYDDEGGNFTGFALNGKARMPYCSEITELECDNNTDLSCPVWMVDYLYDSGFDNGMEYQKNPIDGLAGYWTLSSLEGLSNYACDVHGGTLMGSPWVADNSIYGVRPVINVKL